MLRLLILMLVLSISSLNAQIKVLAFSGSTREDSINTKLVKEAAQLAQQEGAKVTVISLKDYPIPFYDGDLELTQGMPANAKSVRKLMMENDAILIASPEYNGSIPAVLKNIIDWASRNEKGQPSRDAFKGKRFAIMSTSPGDGGGARALAHLKQIIENVGGTVVAVQVSVPNGYTSFTEEGRLHNSQAREELKKEVQQALEAR